MSVAEKLTIIAENMPKVYEAGQQSEYDRFWDIYQENGVRTMYNRAFGNAGWTSEIYKPKYPMQPTSAVAMYQNCAIEGPIDIDFSQCTDFQQTFQDAKQITSLGIIDTRNAPALPRTFQSMQGCVSIQKLILKDDGSQTFINPLAYCSNLMDIVIEGTIGNNGFTVFQATKLSHDSLMSIINALQDKTSVGDTWTVTLGKTNLEKLTDAEKAIATQKGWTLA